MNAPRGQFVRHFMPVDLSTESTATPIIEISPLIRRYVRVVSRSQSGGATDGPRVAVNESLGVLAFAYEKIRNSVENREEHVLLRGAIKRILKRRLNPMWQYESIASALLRELIWARYLKNDSIPEAKVEEIEVLLRKYNVLRQAMAKQSGAEEWQDWIIGIAACDIERVLVDRGASNALAEVMYQTFVKHVRVDGLADEDRDIQLYLAIHRTLLKSDRTLMTYHLFKINASGWEEATQEEAHGYVSLLPKLKKMIEGQLSYPKAHDLARIVKRHTPPYVVLDEVVRREPALALGLFSHPEQSRKRVEEVCQERYSSMRQRVVRAIVRSVIYIFITKMILAFLLEIPYDLYFLGQIHWPQLWFNVGFPPLFMAFLGLSIKTPSQKNTDAIFTRIAALITGELPPERYSLIKKRSAFKPLLSAVYWLSSLGIFWLVGWLLWRSHFTPVGIGLFLFFFGVVVFFAYRVRQIATELTVVKEKQNLLDGLLNLLTLPFLRMGSKLSAEFGKMNVFAFVLDVLLEAPFKLILDLSEHWLNFVRQKQEETVEIQEY